MDIKSIGENECNDENYGWSKRRKVRVRSSVSRWILWISISRERTLGSTSSRGVIWGSVVRSFRETRKRVHFKVKVMLDSLQKSARLLRVLRSLSPSLNFRRLSRVYRENKAYSCLDRDRSSARRFCCKDSFLPHFSKRCSEKKKTDLRARV